MEATDKTNIEQVATPAATLAVTQSDERNESYGKIEFDPLQVKDGTAITFAGTITPLPKHTPKGKVQVHIFATTPPAKNQNPRYYYREFNFAQVKDPKDPTKFLPVYQFGPIQEQFPNDAYEIYAVVTIQRDGTALTKMSHTLRKTLKIQR